MMSKTAKFDPSRLAVATGGTGDPAVFVHGFGSSKLIWEDVCRGLADVFSYYALDLPGSGESPAPRHFDYTLEQFADVLTDFIVMKDLKKLTLVGASLGATVILLALLRNRDELTPRVRALCLMDAIAYPQDLPYFVEILQTPILGPAALNFPSFVKDLPAIFLPPGYARYYGRRRVREALLKTARLIDPERLAPYVRRLKTIQLPTLVIWGRKDGIVPLRLGRRLVRDLPNARLLVIDHSDHWPHQESPAEVVEALKEFAGRTSDDVRSIEPAREPT
jgi:pimeloyl-ACP methyl ester carboxylesterase